MSPAPASSPILNLILCSLARWERQKKAKKNARKTRNHAPEARPRIRTNTTHTEEDARRPEELVAGQGGILRNPKKLGQESFTSDKEGNAKKQNGERIRNKVLSGSSCSQTPYPDLS
jgi:hypothetical protein